ncbi:hypothetical protein JI739_05100 [Ramlibacter sp. AW1]|uniref:Uncharacterized protein n=1 Tax=Ramlibacter aurantiacus TaxID=2801330 RepID=A0A937D3V4_9BURK|nr:hypothetical protein [Ramlibacter aurantiacus]MBL0419722.1 hypothetical protein [Ramlibacter aurantiacus]
MLDHAADRPRPTQCFKRLWQTITPDPEAQSGVVARAPARGLAHPTADTQGVREDVPDPTHERGVSAGSYRAGKFVSGDQWGNGVGPHEPVRFDLAGGGTEPDAFGSNEFIAGSRRAGTEAMVAVNLGTRGAQAARRFVGYGNHTGGTALSDLGRVATTDRAGGRRAG